MALQFVTISTQDLGGGIDTHSSEDRIPEGYSQDLLNVVTKENYLAKRPGYQLFAGGVPLRVLEATLIKGSAPAKDQLALTFDSTVNINTELDLTNVRATPILVYGKMSNTADGAFPYTQNSIQYFTDFRSNPRKTFAIGTNSNTVEGSEFAGVTPYLFVGTTKSLAVIGNDNELFIADSVTIDKSTYDVTVGHINNDESFQGFVYVNQKPIVTGDTYVAAFNTTTDASFSIPASAHNLSNFNIMVRIYEDTGTHYREILPDDLRIAIDGEVSGYIDNNTGTAFDFIVLLSATPLAQVLTGTASASNEVSVVLPNVEEDFLFADCYLEDLGTGMLERVLPNSVVVDVEAKQATIAFSNNRTTEASFKVVYEYATLKTNKLTVELSTSSGTGTVTDTSPQLTVWGLSHEEIYPNATGRAGWVTHVDSYRRANDQRLVCGLGWNFFASYNRDEFRPNPEASPELISSTFLLPSYYPNIAERVYSTRIAGPAFAGNIGSYDRTRGYYKFDGGEEGWAKGVSVSFDEPSGMVKYTCVLDNFTEVVGSGDIVSIDSDTGDYVTVTQSPYAIHNGTFKIESFSLSVAGSTATLSIFVRNPEVDSSDFDDSDCGMDIGIFTGLIELTGTFNPFLVGDLLYSEDLGNEVLLPVISATVDGISGRAIVVCSGFETPMSIPAGLRIFAERTSSVVPLRLLNGTAEAKYFVKDDVVSFTGFDRQMKVKNVVPNPGLSFSLSSSEAGIATVTLSAAPNWIKPGVMVPLHGIGKFSRSYEIVELLSSTEFTIAIDNEDSLTGTISPQFIQLDEDITFRDDQRSGTTVTVQTRWIPIETPEDSYSETPLTQTAHLSGSYTEQPFVRSAMAADTLFLTNGVDPVYKFDGRDIYHAGLPRWQAGAFCSVVAGSGISITAATAAFTAAQGSSFTLTTAADAASFLPGDWVNNGGNSYQVVSTNIEKGTVTVSPLIAAGSTGSITLSYTYRYYFRMEYVDANGNAIPGAATQSDDFSVTLTSTSEVHLRLIGLPQFGPRDYDRLVVKVFRTKRSGAAPYYLVGTNVVAYSEGTDYIDFIDTRSDDSLGEADLDAESISIFQAEIPTAITLPQRAKYCTSTDNRMVLGYIQAYPEMTIQVTKNGSITESDLAGKVLTFTRPSDNKEEKFEFVNSGAVTITNIQAVDGEVTITFGAGPTVTEGDWVYLFRDAVSTTAKTIGMGWHKVVSAGATSFVVNTSIPNMNAAPSTVYVNRFVNKANVPVWLGTDGNYADTEWNTPLGTAGTFSLVRLANSINCTQRLQGTTAWLTAASGNDFNTGQMVVNSISTEEAIGFTLSSAGNLLWFVDGVRYTGTTYSFSRLYPSRLLVSYRNKPEVFDAPTVALDVDSDSVIDVNTSDGQYITGVIPFFGEAAFTASQKAAILAVFKQNSIYLVDLVAKANGLNPVQKIDSQGIGCTAPYSLANTKDGVVFANEGGIYRLNHDLTVEFLGQLIERLYGQNVNVDRLEIAQGHNHAVERRYQLSVPFAESEVNTDVLVYDHSREQSRYDQKPGSWTRFDNFPVTGWTNLGIDSYFASSRGKVFKLRNTGDTSDYRDDEDPILMRIDLRAMDFGDAGVRKTFPHVLLRFRGGSDNLGTIVSTASDLSSAFAACDQFKTDLKDRPDGLSDLLARQLYTIRFSVRDNRGMFLQVRVENGSKDETCELTQLAVKVAGLKAQGTTEAQTTTKSNGNK